MSDGVDFMKNILGHLLVICLIITTIMIIQKNTNYRNSNKIPSKDMYRNMRPANSAYIQSPLRSDLIQAYRYDLGENMIWWESGFGNEVIIGIKPFENLSINDIEYATVEIPPHDKVDLTDNEIEELVILLKNIVTYDQVNLYKEYVGVIVIFTLTRADGINDTVATLNPLVIINDVGYRTAYWPSQLLSNFGHGINIRS